MNNSILLSHQIQLDFLKKDVDIETSTYNYKFYKETKSFFLTDEGMKLGERLALKLSEE